MPHEHQVIGSSPIISIFERGNIMEIEYEHILNRISQGTIRESDLKSLESSFENLLQEKEKPLCENTELKTHIERLKSKVKDIEDELLAVTRHRDTLKIFVDNENKHNDALKEKETKYRQAIKTLAGML